MKDTPKKPLVTKELIEYLERNFPNRCPSPTDTDREVWMAVGAVRVVKNLQNLYETQNQTVIIK